MPENVGRGAISRPAKIAAEWASKDAAPLCWVASSTTCTGCIILGTPALMSSNTHCSLRVVIRLYLKTLGASSACCMGSCTRCPRWNVLLYTFAMHHAHECHAVRGGKPAWSIAALLFKPAWSIAALLFKPAWSIAALLFIYVPCVWILGPCETATLFNHTRDGRLVDAKTGQCVDLADSGSLGSWKCGTSQPNQHFAVDFTTGQIVSEASDYALEATFAGQCASAGTGAGNDDD